MSAANLAPAAAADLVAQLRQWRSLMFIPSHREDFIGKAAERGADAIVLDLEDGVPLDRKQAARDLLAAHATRLAQAGMPVMVRVNGPALGAAEDAAAAVAAGVRILMMPKVERAADILAMAGHLDACELRAGSPIGATGLIAQLESSRGVLNALAIADSSPRIVGFAFGSEDFSAELGVAASPTALAAPGQAIVMAAAAVSCPAFGVVGSLTAFSALDIYDEAVRNAAALGFSGALCISPRQVPLANRAFTPSVEAQDWASRILAGAAGRTGAFAVAGEMVDAPVIERARAIVRRSRRSEPVSPA